MYKTYPIQEFKKPSWLLDRHDGKLPAVSHMNVTLTGPLAIAEYLEKTYPHTSLTKQGIYSYQEILEKTKDFYPALSALILNKLVQRDRDLIAAMEEQLDLLDEMIRKTAGRYLCGLELTLADLYLLPQLFHAMVALDHFKDMEIYNVGGDPTRPALESYMARMLDMTEFNDKRVYCSVDEVVYGWKVARGDIPNTR